mgnify:CR=1 FL=1
MTEREIEATSFIHHWSGSPKIWTRTNYWSRSWPVHEESWTRIGGFMIDDGCRCGRHVNIPENFDILLIIMLSQSILIRPLKSLIGVNNWRRCDTSMNVDVMSWMASICRTLVRAKFGKNTRSFATLWAVVKNDPLPCLIEIDETANSCLLITTFATRRWETEQQRGFCWPEYHCRNLTHGWQFEVQSITNQVNYPVWCWLCWLLLVIFSELLVRSSTGWRTGCPSSGSTSLTSRLVTSACPGRMRRCSPGTRSPSSPSAATSRWTRSAGSGRGRWRPDSR